MCIKTKKNWDNNVINCYGYLESFIRLSIISLIELENALEAEVCDDKIQGKRYIQ